MATNKAKRSIHLAQPQARNPNARTDPSPKTGSGFRLRAPSRTRRGFTPAKRLNLLHWTPVKPHVYYAIAEMNTGLEKAIHNLHMLQSNGLFGASGLAEMNRVLRGIHARANRQLIMALNERETANDRANLTAKG